MALSLTLWVIASALIVVLFTMYKYNVEGEAVPPFIIEKMVVVSTAKTEDLKMQDETYTAEVVQNNDIKIAINKNPEYKKEAVIDKITINNIQILENSQVGNVEMYRPSKGIKNYEYIDEYKIADTLEYEGSQETYLKNDVLQIANQGGVIELSIILNNLGEITYGENELLKVDGTLLKQLGIEELSYKISFDLIVELTNGIKLKTKINLSLPVGDILTNGIETFEETNLKTVFKRI